MTAMRSKPLFSTSTSIAHQSASKGTVNFAFSKSHVLKSTFVESIFADPSMKRSLSSLDLILKRYFAPSASSFFSTGRGVMHMLQPCTAQLTPRIVPSNHEFVVSLSRPVCYIPKESEHIMLVR